MTVITDLSRRQRQVLELMAEGREVVNIAAILEVSRRTILAYRSQLYRLSDSHNPASLLRYFYHFMPRAATPARDLVLEALSRRPYYTRELLDRLEREARVSSETARAVLVELLDERRIDFDRDCRLVRLSS